RGIHSLPSTSPVLGIVLLGFAAPFISWFVRDDYFAQGALFASAFILAAALLAVPAYLALRNSLELVRAEHLLLGGLVYWLLLDLLQGAYALEDVTEDGMRYALLAVAVFACGIWTSALFRPWPLPKILRRSAELRLSADTLFVI